MIFQLIVLAMLILLYIPAVPTTTPLAILLGFTFFVLVDMYLDWQPVESRYYWPTIGVFLGAVVIAISLYFWGDVTTLLSLPSVMDTNLVFIMGYFTCMFSIFSGVWSNPNNKKRIERLWKGVVT